MNLFRSQSYLTSARYSLARYYFLTISVAICIFYFYNLLTIDVYNTVFGGDAEPDYLINSLLIYNSGFPLSSHHPGSFSFYLYSVSTSLALMFNLDLSGAVLLGRIINGILFSLAFYHISINNVKIVFNILFIFVVIAIFPELRHLVFKMSAESFTLSFIIIFYNCLKKRNYIYSSLIFGLLLNIKLSNILILPIYLYYLKYQSQKNQFKLLFFSLVVYVLLLIPYFNNGWAFLYAPLNFLRVISGLLCPNYYFSFFLFVISLIVILFYYLFVQKKNTVLFNFISFSKRHLNIIFIVLVISIFLFSFTFDLFISRHFLSLFLFISLRINFSFPGIWLNRMISFGFFILSIFSFSEKKRSSLDDFLVSSNAKKYVFQESAFNSKILFLMWGRYRYAMNMQVIPKSWWRHKNIGIDSLEYLNLRESASLPNLNSQILNMIEHQSYFIVQSESLSEFLTIKSKIEVENKIFFNHVIFNSDYVVYRVSKKTVKN